MADKCTMKTEEVVVVEAEEVGDLKDTRVSWRAAEILFSSSFLLLFSSFFFTFSLSFSSSSFNTGRIFVQ